MSSLHYWMLYSISCAEPLINNTNHRRVILQELGFKELVVVDTDK